MINVVIEGFPPRQFNAGVRAGAVENAIRTGHGLRNGYLSQGQLSFTDEEILQAGDYVFYGFTPGGKRILYHDLFIL